MAVVFKKRRGKPVFILLLLVPILAGSLLGVERALFPTILAIAEAKAVQMAVNTVQNAVGQYMKQNHVSYEDVVSVHKDREGRAVLLEVNTAQVSEVAADLALAAEKSLASLDDKEFGLPLGQVLGSQLLASYGPRIKVRLIPVGAVKVNLQDKFEEAGINQTRHRISLSLDARVRIVIPLQKTEVKVVTQVPLVDSIIVGNIPATYVSIPGGLFGTGQLRLDAGNAPQGR